MTIPRAATRRRRTGAAIPEPIRAWFTGERRSTFLAAGLPHRGRLHEMWAEWVADHPDAKPPERYEWLDPGHPEHARCVAQNARYRGRTK